jgi:hypothetical protein
MPVDWVPIALEVSAQFWSIICLTNCAKFIISCSIEHTRPLGVQIRETNCLVACCYIVLCLHNLVVDGVVFNIASALIIFLHASERL